MQAQQVEFTLVQAHQFLVRMGAAGACRKTAFSEYNRTQEIDASSYLDHVVVNMLELYTRHLRSPPPALASKLKKWAK